MTAMQAEGMYGVKPPLPATAGNEGVAVVQQVGPDVTTVKVGDWVIPAKAPFGELRPVPYHCCRR